MDSSRRKRCHSDKRRSSSSSSEEDSYSEDESSSTSGSSSDSESERDERHHKRSRSRRKKKSGSEAHKKSQHSKHRRHSESGRDKKHRKKDKKKKSSSRPDPIAEDHYFLKSSEFRKWLSQERGIFFSDLSSAEARALFKKFVSKWNSGRLKEKYYQDVQSSSLHHSSQTQYKWKFSGEERESLSSMRKMVSSWTASGGGGGEEGRGAQAKSQSQPARIGPRPGPSREEESGPVIGPMLPSMMAAQSPDPFEEEDRRAREKQQLKMDRREFRKHKEMVLDELLPKATGREARLEKKRIRSEQRREREISPDIGESSIMGTSHSIQERIKARQDSRQHRAQAAAQKVSDYEAKERARVNAILEMAKAHKKEGSLW